jgi:hypothetical protein
MLVRRTWRFLFTPPGSRASPLRAEELGPSPAYIRKRIALLEDALRVKLFHRSTRHVSLTERGEVMLSWAQRVLDVYGQLDGALDNICACGCVRAHSRLLRRSSNGAGVTDYSRFAADDVGFRNPHQ